MAPGKYRYVKTCTRHNDRLGLSPNIIWGHDLGHTDTHTNQPPRAGVQLVDHTSIIFRYLALSQFHKIDMKCFVWWYKCFANWGTLYINKYKASSFSSDKWKMWKRILDNESIAWYIWVHVNRFPFEIHTFMSYF